MFREFAILNVFGAIIYGVFSWFISDYFFTTVFDKDLPWWADIIIGFFGFPILLPADIIIFTLTFFYNTPLWQNF